MRAIWNIISSTASSELSFSGGGRTRGLTVVRRPRANGLRLAVDPRDASVRLTLAPRAPLKPALAWAAGKRDWVEAELARLPVAVPVVPGLMFGVGDARVRVAWDSGLPRSPSLVIPAKAGIHLLNARREMDHRLRGDDGEGGGGDEQVLQVGGPLDSLGPRVLRFLRAHALKVLDAETHSLAAAHGIAVGKVGVGDPKSRWGSCAASGDIRYSWRLILAPGFVRRATVAHEVAHRVHMHHGATFHALVAELHGADPAPARRWLREHGPALHWFGREA